MLALTSPITARLHSCLLAVQCVLEDRRAQLHQRGDEGASVLEYVGATIAALTLAAALIVLMKTGPVPGLVESIVKGALGKFLKI
jgi:hypothetical protein